MSASSMLHLQNMTFYPVFMHFLVFIASSKGEKKLYLYIGLNINTGAHVGSLFSSLVEAHFSVCREITPYGAYQV